MPCSETMDFFFFFFRATASGSLEMKMSTVLSAFPKQTSVGTGSPIFLEHYCISLSFLFMVPRYILALTEQHQLLHESTFGLLLAVWHVLFYVTSYITGRQKFHRICTNETIPSPSPAPFTPTKKKKKKNLNKGE